MRKHSVMILTLIISVALLVPAIPKISADINLSGFWSAEFVVWLGGDPVPYSGYPGPPSGFPWSGGPFAGWYFIGTITGTWQGTYNSLTGISGTLTGTYGGDFYDSTTTLVYPAQTSGSVSVAFTNIPISSTGLATVTLSGDITGTWTAPMIHFTSVGLGTMGTIYYNPPPAICPVTITDTGNPFYTQSTEWVYINGTIDAKSMEESSVRGPSVVTPYLPPGSAINVDIIVDDVTRMYAFNLTLSYDPSILTATSFSVPQISGGPNFPWIWSTSHIDAETETVVIGANTANETASQPPYYAPLITTTTPLPIARITFIVTARGLTTLDIHDSKLYNRYMAPMEPHLEIDGLFDNRFQGKLFTPNYKDEDLKQGDSFSIDIYVDDVTKLWGYQFILSYDTNVLTAYDWEPLSIFTILAPWEINDPMGYAVLAANSYMGDPIGLTTSTPEAIARIYFTVDQDGWSCLDLHDEVLANVYGNVQIVEVIDGSFASVNVADLKGRGAWPDFYKFVQSEHVSVIDTLYARITTNMTGPPVRVKAVFNVYDAEAGILLGTIETDTITLPELSETILTADFDTTAWGTPRYKVWIGAQVHYDISGDDVMDFTGDRIKTIHIVVTP